MKFYIYKTSDYNNKEKPCSKAYSEDVSWNIHDGSVKTEPRWFIDVNSAQDFLDLIAEVNCPLVIEEDEDWYHTKAPRIEIYDDYRE